MRSYVIYNNALLGKFKSAGKKTPSLLNSQEFGVKWRLYLRNIGVALALQILLISSWCHADVRVNKVEADLQTISTALTLFKLDVGRYPTRREGVGTLVYSKKSAKLENYPASGYLTRQPDDGWGNPLS
ncbi:MAG: type II secretion system protein GspG [Pseudomonadales bacterium]|nr:type II secretion system protein GspG [Pseudomonadales bacterium]